MKWHSDLVWRRALALPLILGLCGTCGCGSSGNGSGVTFHGEQTALPGFSYDTGYQPSTPPVQVRLALSSAGSLTAEAKAAGSGDSMTPQAGSGLFVMDAHLEIHAAVKINVAGVGQFEGPIPGAPAVDLAFGGQTAFAPFLLGGATANVTADVPETLLAEIPLGALPGKLVIKALGTVASEFSGVCAQARGGVGQYTGATTTGGTVTLRPSVVLEVPLVGSQTYDIPEIPVTISPTGGPMDLGIKSLADGTDAAGPGPCGAVAQDGGVGDGGADGGGSCNLSCPGCCQGNECKGGTEASACGKGGHECASCHGGSPYCVEGVCTGGSSCNQTCSGCCEGDVCRGGSATGACGLGGVNCAVCVGADQCVTGYCKGSGSCASTCSGCCVGEACQGGTTTSACGSGGATCAACATNHRCGAARTCEVDPTSRWDIVAVDAQLPALDPNGDTWDSYAYTDPDGFVTIYTYISGAQHLEGDSPVVNDSLTPVWNAVVLAGVLAGEILDGGLGFALYDYDPTTFNDYIDSCSGFVPEAEFDGQPHAACGGLIPMRYKLIPH
jgi:hypothetical protein